MGRIGPDSRFVISRGGFPNYLTMARNSPTHQQDSEEAQKTEEARLSKRDRAILCRLIALVVGLWLGSWIIIGISFGSWSDRGQFGDMFGAANSLFSGLAFAGLIFTILLQRRELALQREELALAREELERSADAQERSGEALTAQLQASAISTQLSAVSLLIGEKIQHLSGYHPSELRGKAAAALTVEAKG